MIDAASRATLLNLVRSEGRSLLQYVGESFPWTTAEEKAALARLQNIVEEEREALTRLIRFLVRQRIVGTAPLGPYPMEFTNINYISLDHLLPLLVDSQRQRVQALETQLKSISDPDCRQQVADYIAVIRGHLTALEELAQPQPV